MAIVVSAPLVPADPYSLPRTEVRALPQSSNGRNYALYVGLPASYATSPNRHYPVVYGLDGYWNFSLLLSEAGTLNYDGAIPECIVVGIAYGGTEPDVGALRGYDFTYPADPYSDPAGNSTGGGRKFLQVIADEFIPFIQTHYRADPSYRVLAGGSAGGLFTAFALFERPGLFQAYIAVSPGDLRYANNYVFSREQDYARTHTSLPVRLFLGYGTDEIYSSIAPTTREFYAQVRNSHYTDMVVVAREVLGEGHGGAGPDAFNRGLRFAFAPLAPRPFAGIDPGFASRSSLFNLSTRGRVGSGENVLIAGLIIQGLEPKRVLVRAVGPSLGPLGVQDALPNPRFHVVNAARDTIASNDNWNDNANATAIATVAAQVGAFALPAGSRDAAMLLTLDPGLYTVVVESADGTSGVALVESYEVVP